MSPRLLTLAAVAAVLAYAAGLAGPFVLDDHANLAPVWRWWAGAQGGAETIFENRSGPLGRPLAYLSFMANAWLGGQASLGFKVANLGLHLANAGLVYLLLRHLLAGVPARAPAPDPRAEAAAVALAALWLLHPMHVSSVLYVVQRMALLGALAQLAAVLAYLHGRQVLADDPQQGRRWLFIAFPGLVALGLAGKETAALAPLLCAVVELFRPTPGPRPRELRWFFGLFLVLPALLALALLATNPGRLGSGYAAREFDLAARLLTQPRVLADYALAWFWPSPGHLHLYRDGFAHSSGLWQPLSAALAIAAWAALALAGWLARRRLPLFSLGVFWFFAGHVLESSVVALEPYFEHRNYLPSLGLLLAVYGLLGPGLARLPGLARQSVVLVAVLLLTVSTGIRAQQWGDFDHLLDSEGPELPELSRRLQVDRAIRGLELGDPARSQRALAELATGNAGDRAAAALWQAILGCDRDGRLDPAARQALDAAQPPVLTHNHVSWLALLARPQRVQTCEGLEPGALLALVDRWQAGTAKPVTRRNRARLEAIRGPLRGLAPAETVQ